MRRLALLSTLVLSLSCSSDVGKAAPVPPTQPPRLDEAEPNIRADLEGRFRALTDATAGVATTDSRLALRYGDLGISLLAFGYYDEALVAFEGAVQLAPGDIRWPYYLGHAARRTGDMEAAARAFQRALEIDAHDIKPRLWLAESRLRREDLVAAEEAFRIALDQEPHCAQAWTGLGKIALSRDDYGQAEAHLLQALEHRPDSARARYSLALALRGLGRLDEAREQLARLEGANQSLTITCFEDPLMQAVHRRQTGTRGHQDRAMAARNQGRLVAALVELRAAVSANPNRYPARYDIASIQLQLGRVEEARSELEALLEVAPRYAAALSLLGRLEGEAGRWARADELLALAVDADPDSEQIHRDKGDLLLVRGRHLEALGAYQRAVAIDSTFEAALIGRALCLAALDRRREALDDLERSRNQLPSRNRLTLALAYLLLDAGPAHDTVRASALTRRAIDEQPTTGAAFLLARVNAVAGQFPEAVQWQERALAALAAARVQDQPRRYFTELLAEYERGNAPAPTLDYPTLAALLSRQPLEPGPPASHRQEN